MSAVKIMILLCQFIFFLVTFTFQLSILIPFLFIWSRPDEYKRPVILYCDQSCNVWRSFNNKAKYYNDSSHLWQGRSLMSFLKSINTDNALLLSDLGTSSQISSKLILNFTCLVKKWWPVWEKCLGSGFTAATPRRVKMCLRWKLKCCVSADAVCQSQAFYLQPNNPLNFKLVQKEKSWAKVQVFRQRQ